MGNQGKDKKENATDSRLGASLCDKMDFGFCLWGEWGADIRGSVGQATLNPMMSTICIPHENKK